MTWSRDLSRLDYLPIIKNNITALTFINRERVIRLFRTTAEGVVPDLAQSWSFDPDKSTFEITLRTGCGWSDGKPITAYDVKAGIEAVFLPEAVQSIPGRDVFPDGKAVYAGELPVSALGIEAVDATTLRIPAVVSMDLVKYTLAQTQFTPMPLHKIQSDPQYWMRPGMPTVASGPYFPVSVSSEKIVMHKNPYFCGDGPVAFDEVVIFHSSGPKDDLRLIDEQNLSIFGHNTFWREEANVHLKEINRAYHTIPQSSAITDYLFLNVERPAFADPRVREAFRLMLELRDFSSEHLSGSAAYMPKSIFPLPGGGAEYPLESATRPERVKRAQALMAEAGYTKARPLVLKYLSRSFHARVRVFTNAIISMVAPLPIELTVDWKTSTKEFYDIARARGKTDYDIHSTIWWNSLPSDPSSFLTHLMTYATFSTAGRDQLEKMIDASYKEHDTQKRRSLFESISELMIDEGSIIPLASQRESWFLSNRIKRISDSGFVDSTRDFAPVQSLSNDPALDSE